jgi:Co/Zn/Cd efflux system component
MLSFMNAVVLLGVSATTLVEAYRRWRRDGLVPGEVTLGQLEVRPP